MSEVMYLLVSLFGLSCNIVSLVLVGVVTGGWPLSFSGGWPISFSGCFFALFLGTLAFGPYLVVFGLAFLFGGFFVPLSQHL